MELCQLCNGHGPSHQGQQLVHHPPPQRRMREGVTVHPVFVYQPASRFMEQPGVHRHTRHIRAKGRPPKVPKHSSRRKKLSQIVHSHILGTTMLFMQNSHTTSPSKQCTSPPGTATTVPIPNEHSSCVYPRRLRRIPGTVSNGPADCVKTPTPAGRNSPGGAAPFPPEASAWFDTRFSATAGGEK